jgi:hypothetical protein
MAGIVRIAIKKIRIIVQKIFMMRFLFPDLLIKNDEMEKRG